MRRNLTLISAIVWLGIVRGIAQQGIYHLGYASDSHSNSTDLGNSALGYPCWGWRGGSYDFSRHQEGEYEVHLSSFPIWLFTSVSAASDLRQPYEKSRGAFDFLDFFQEGGDFYSLGKTVLSWGAHLSFTYLKNAHGSEFVLPIGLGVSAHYHAEKTFAVASLHGGVSINVAPYAGGSLTAYYEFLSSLGAYGRLKFAHYFSDLNTTQVAFEAGLTFDWSGVI